MWNTNFQNIIHPNLGQIATHLHLLNHTIHLHLFNPTIRLNLLNPTTHLHLLNPTIQLRLLQPVTFLMKIGEGWSLYIILLSLQLLPQLIIQLIPRLLFALNYDPKSLNVVQVSQMSVCPL